MNVPRSLCRGLALAAAVSGLAFPNAGLAAGTPELKLRFGFDGGSAFPKVAGAGGDTAVPVLDQAGGAIDRRGVAGSGVGGRANGRCALDFSSPLGQGTNGPVAALTNSSLGFGDVKAGHHLVQGALPSASQYRPTGLPAGSTR